MNKDTLVLVSDALSDSLTTNLSPETTFVRDFSRYAITELVNVGLQDVGQISDVALEVLGDYSGIVSDALEVVGDAIDVVPIVGQFISLVIKVGTAITANRDAEQQQSINRRCADDIRRPVKRLNYTKPTPSDIFRSYNEYDGAGTLLGDTIRLCTYYDMGSRDPRFKDSEFSVGGRDAEYKTLVRWYREKRLESGKADQPTLGLSISRRGRYFKLISAIEAQADGTGDMGEALWLVLMDMLLEDFARGYLSQGLWQFLCNNMKDGIHLYSFPMLARCRDGIKGKFATIARPWDGVDGMMEILRTWDLTLHPKSDKGIAELNERRAKLKTTDVAGIVRDVSSANKITRWMPGLLMSDRSNIDLKFNKSFLNLLNQPPKVIIGNSPGLVMDAPGVTAQIAPAAKSSNVAPLLLGAAALWLISWKQ